MTLLQISHGVIDCEAMRCAISLGKQSILRLDIAQVPLLVTIDFFDSSREDY